MILEKTKNIPVTLRAHDKG